MLDRAEAKLLEEEESSSSNSDEEAVLKKCMSSRKEHAQPLDSFGKHQQKKDRAEEHLQELFEQRWTR